MKLENQFCTPEQAKKLNELGVTTKVFFAWELNYEPKPRIVISVDWSDPNHLPAYSCAELGDVLSRLEELSAYATWSDHSDCWECWLHKLREDEKSGSIYWDIEHCVEADFEAEAKAAVLIYMIEAGHITAAQVNEKLAA